MYSFSILFRILCNKPIFLPQIPDDRLLYIQFMNDTSNQDAKVNLPAIKKKSSPTWVSLPICDEHGRSRK